MSRVIVGLLIVLIVLVSRVLKVASEELRDVVEFTGILLAWYGRKRFSGKAINWVGLYKPVAPLLLVFCLGGCALFRAAADPNEQVQADVAAVKADLEALKAEVVEHAPAYVDRIDVIVQEVGDKDYLGAATSFVGLIGDLKRDVPETVPLIKKTIEDGKKAWKDLKTQAELDKGEAEVQAPEGVTR